MTWSPFVIFCLKCNVKTPHHAIPTPTLLFKCNDCGMIFDHIPCISQITFEQYIKDKQLRKEHDKACDDALWEGYAEVKKQIALAERHEKNALNGGENSDERSVWHRVVRSVAKWWRVDESESLKAIRQSNDIVYRSWLHKEKQKGQ